MRLICRNAFSTLDKFLGKHSLGIINSNPIRYARCRNHMEAALEAASSTPHDMLKKRLNMMFSVGNLSEVFEPHREVLFDCVRTGTIRCQQDLDKLTNWLSSELRRNSQITKEGIEAQLGQWTKQSQSDKSELASTLDKMLAQQGDSADISDLTKRMRAAFPTVPSSDIYDEVRKRFTNNATRENKLIWDKLGSLKPRLLPYETNNPEVWAQHQKITGGQLRFRFPPEPNGYLHIGHCKSIRINFQTAKRLGGHCFLRFDDTNPDSESHEFIDNILKEVRWMGYQPDQVTYASDYFQQLMELALQLIKQGKAYVCNTPQQQIQQQRRNRQSNPQRESPIEHSLKYFPGLMPHQTLRLKLDPTATNPTLRDPIIYRTKSKPHPRTQYRYRIYPTYDFTHCISDSLQHIDYSLCSLEFEIRRQLYYQILDMLSLYKPVVWEYSRLNIEGNFLSKRKIAKLVQQKTVQGWDDPRLLTIAGLRNRGYTPSMLNSFIDRINVARAGNQNVIQANVLQIEMRRQLNKTAERAMAVLKPAHLHIINLQNQVKIDVALFPDRPDAGTRTILLQKHIYIESQQDLTVGKEVNLKYFKRIRITKVYQQDGANRYQAEIVPTANGQQSKKTVNLHWISPEDGIQAKVVGFIPLIAQDGQTVNPRTEENYNEAIIPRNLDRSKTYQFERLGYFKFHRDRLICCCWLT